MRFLADGPNLPDDLLVARDEGQVIFFCGAGVSQARAKLPGFLGLAKTILTELGAVADGAARKLLATAEELEDRAIPGLGSLVSTDRIFGLLEREFDVSDIRSKVARVLRPKGKVDLAAHKIILDLARAPDGRMRLVTTNFDRLFEMASPHIGNSAPPRLPDPSLPGDLQGIVHLHGSVTDDYSGARTDEFVLSTADFGRAYLAEGWATRFIQSLMTRYQIVFVGYSADDPPIHYLLEALHSSVGRRTRTGLFAFQAGSDEQARLMWSHKGVQPIAYDGSDSHRALWESLAAWAERARDPDGWYRSRISLAGKGPVGLQAHERGQIAHIVSTNSGVKYWSGAQEMPPSDWLLVFDPHARYAPPRRLNPRDNESSIFDPFDAYGLDSDPSPMPFDTDDWTSKREVAPGAWDAFVSTRKDRLNIRDDNISSIRGSWSITVPTLPARLDHLGSWLGAVSDQPTALWWAAAQVGLHPSLQFNIERRLARTGKATSASILRGWRLLLEKWDRSRQPWRREWFELTDTIESEGWSQWVVRAIARATAPFISVEQASSRPEAISADVEIRMEHLIHLDVSYPQFTDLKIPDDFVIPAIRQFRKNLELAVDLERESTPFDLLRVCSIEPGQRGRSDPSFERSHGIGAAVLHYVRLMDRLRELDHEAAREEALAWPKGGDKVFDRLRIWSASKSDIFSGAEAGSIFLSLSDDAFWEWQHQRDLLLALSARWQEIPSEQRALIQNKILGGPVHWTREGDDGTAELRRAYSALSRHGWLVSQGCFFDSSPEALEALKSLAPDWTSERAETAAESSDSRGGMVHVDTSPDELMEASPADILGLAEQLGGRTSDFLLERDPFAGLVASRPTKALAALRTAAKAGRYPAAYWERFLGSDARKSDSSRMMLAVATTLSRFPTEAASDNLRAITRWMDVNSPRLAETSRALSDHLWDLVLALLAEDPLTARSAIIRSSGADPDWVMEALNSPVGRLMDVLIRDPMTNGLEAQAKLPDSWKARANGLLALSEELRCHALTTLGQQLNWLFAVDPEWTDVQLLSVLEGAGGDADAVWAGFFASMRVPDQPLYARIKGNLLRSINEHPRHRRQEEALAGMVLAGWATQLKDGRRMVSDEELREALVKGEESFRLQVLWHLDRWSSQDIHQWRQRGLDLLLRIWPLQIGAKSDAVSTRLAELALDSGDRFPELVDAILPLIRPVEDQQLRFSGLLHSQSEIAAGHPRELLALLYAVLPTDASIWPWGIEHTIERLAENALLKTDVRLSELRRRWSAR
jgi:hypothetical protein